MVCVWHTRSVSVVHMCGVRVVNIACGVNMVHMCMVCVWCVWCACASYVCPLGVCIVCSYCEHSAYVCDVRMCVVCM